MWLNIYAPNGYEKSLESSYRITKNMTPSQIEKAQDLARECVKKNYKRC